MNGLKQSVLVFSVAIALAGMGVAGYLWHRHQGGPFGKLRAAAGLRADSPLPGPRDPALYMARKSIPSKESGDSNKGRPRESFSTRPALSSVSEKKIAPADRVTARRHLARAASQAVERADFEEAALLNSFLAQEALLRAHRATLAWKNHLRDRETGLIPRTTSDKYWNGRDTAADCFPFLWLTTHYLDPESEFVWLAALNKERELSGPLPCVIGLEPMKLRSSNLENQIFDGAEYVKDGLISIADRRGRGPWFDRMLEITDTIIDNAQTTTTLGTICANDSEVNGDLLQVLPRLYWATGNEKYLRMAERIAEVYLFEILPKNNGLPAARWDFHAGKPSGKAVFQFRDHGNEIIPGLAEVYFLEKSKGRPQAERYREPLIRFLDLVLQVGRTEDGMWHDLVDTQTREVLSKREVDNWGYILNAHATFDAAERTNRYGAEIERAMRAASMRKSVEWESRTQDGYADSIESMLYMLAWKDIPEGRIWVDDEIEVLFLKQQDNGLIEANYLDGNFIRTALLYGHYKAQGATLSPWREDVRLGAAHDKANGSLHLHIASFLPWRGRVQLDFPRHREFWNMPRNYPRLNAWPEWYTAENGNAYEVTDLDSGEIRRSDSCQLRQGIPVQADGIRPVRLSIRPVPSADKKSED